MRLLVDTHIGIWWLGDNPRLSDRARKLVQNGHNQLLWSLASSWEIAVKVNIGKLELGRPINRFFADLVRTQQMELLRIGHEHCIQYVSLPLEHKDPFDRMLVAQAQIENCPILTADPKLALYDVETIF